MIAKVIPISKHKRYEHAHFTVYKKWIYRLREAKYRSRGWSLEPRPIFAPDRPTLLNILHYEDLIRAYKIKVEVDSVTEFQNRRIFQKPEIFSLSIALRSKMVDKAIAANFSDDNE
jgi:hypothetical protein